SLLVASGVAPSGSVSRARAETSRLRWTTKRAVDDLSSRAWATGHQPKRSRRLSCSTTVLPAAAGVTRTVTTVVRRPRSARALIVWFRTRIWTGGLIWSPATARHEGLADREQ